MSHRIFKTQAAFRAWLEKNHATAKELTVAHDKRAAGKVAMTSPEAVDEALCFGWIDGVVNKIDDGLFCHRFTSRKRGSIWSLVNVKHVERLRMAGVHDTRRDRRVRVAVGCEDRCLLVRTRNTCRVWRDATQDV